MVTVMKATGPMDKRTVKVKSVSPQLEIATGVSFTWASTTAKELTSTQMDKSLLERCKMTSSTDKVKRLGLMGPHTKESTIKGT